jgi:hypothetical protein
MWRIERRLGRGWVPTGACWFCFLLVWGNATGGLVAYWNLDESGKSGSTD